MIQSAYVVNRFPRNSSQERGCRRRRQLGLGAFLLYCVAFEALVLLPSDRYCQRDVWSFYFNGAQP
jgi:hypothetical protein